MTYNIIRNSHFTDFIHADQLVCQGRHFNFFLGGAKFF